MSADSIEGPRCPACGAVNDDATRVDRTQSGPPAAGAVSVCFNCAALGERRELLADQRVVDALYALRMFRERR